MPKESDEQAMSRERLLGELAKHRRYCERRSPFYAAVLQALEEDAARAPAWLRLAEEAWNGRRFLWGWEGPHLLLACLHYSALLGHAPELAAVFPSCGGSGRAPGKAVLSFLGQAPQSFWAELRHARLQTNEAGRGAAWMLAACAVFGSSATPFHLVELGAAAGLNLIGDFLPRRARFVSRWGQPLDPPAHWGEISYLAFDRAGLGPEPRWRHAVFNTVSRLGLDIEPRYLTDRRDLLWLKACIFADDVERLQRFAQAAHLFSAVQKTSFAPRIERSDFSGSPDWLRRIIPVRAGEGLLVFNAAASTFLDASEYAVLRREMTSVLRPWGERGVWVECERPRGADGMHELLLHRVCDGVLATRRLALMSPSCDEIRLCPGWNTFPRTRQTANAAQDHDC